MSFVETFQKVTVSELPEINVEMSQTRIQCHLKNWDKNDNHERIANLHLIWQDSQGALYIHQLATQCHTVPKTKKPCVTSSSSALQAKMRTHARVSRNRETKNLSRYTCNLRLVETSLNIGFKPGPLQRQPKTFNVTEPFLTKSSGILMKFRSSGFLLKN